MHDTVVRTRKLVLQEEPHEDFADIFSQRLQEAGLSRALTEPLSAHLALLYQEAFRWLHVSFQLEALPADADPQSVFAELHFSSRQIRVALDNAIPFLERAEDNLSEKEEITHRESAYEREVAPFSRLESTQAFRDLLSARPEFSSALVGEGAQVQGDLLKILYMESRMRQGISKPGDLYALVAELVLDGRRHLIPALADGADFLQALGKAGHRG
jgi:hypothetical protein